MIRRAFLFGFLTVTLLASAPFASAASIEDDSRTFVKGLADRAIAVLKADVPKAQRDKVFEDLLREGFDTKAIGIFCVGGYWNKMTEQERTEYLALFEKLIVQTYSSRMASVYNGQSLEIGAARPDGKAGAWVTSKIVSTNAADEPIRIDWRVRQVDGKGLKIIDVVVTNISMVVTQRDDFVGILQRNNGNIPDFLTMLRDKVAKLQAT
jgi:phospholipid transport system substrate-binding protein